MRSSDSIAAIAPALVAAVGELGPVAKDATNPAFRNKYASLDSIMEQVRPVLARHGLAVVQSMTAPDTVDGRVVGLAVETRLIHRSGEWLAGSVTLPVEKATAQGTGSALSYGRRYGLSALLGLTAEDDDGNAASTRQPMREETRQQPRATAAAPALAAPDGRLYEAVPNTPRRKAFTGDVDEALQTPYPFKKNPAHHGKPLGELPEAVLLSTAKWCRETDAVKFSDLLSRIDAVVSHWNTIEQEQENLANADALRDDPLPF